jgi:hypothetical protein
MRKALVPIVFTIFGVLSLRGQQGSPAAFPLDEVTIQQLEMCGVPATPPAGLSSSHRAYQRDRP